MIIVLTIIHVIVCLFLVIVVLLQSGKAADLAGAFGGMGSQTAFGPRGSATVLSKATTIAAALFMVTSLTLAIMASRGSGGGSSVVDKSKPKPVTTQPATPPGPATQPGGPRPGQPGVTSVPLSTDPNREAKPGEPQVTITPADEKGRPVGPGKTLPLNLPKEALPKKQ